MGKTERIVWLCALVLTGFVCTRISGRAAGEGTKAESHPEAMRVRTSARGSDPARGRDARPAAEGERSSGPADRQLRDALRNPDPLRRLGAFLAVLETCGPGDLGEMTATMEELKRSGLDLRQEEALLNFRAGQLDGAVLLSGITGGTDDLAKLESLRPGFEGWLQADSAAASRWLESLPDGVFRDQLAVEKFSALASDPLTSARETAALPKELRGIAANRLARQLLKTQSTEAISESLSTLAAAPAGDPNYLSTLFGSLIAQATAGDGTEAAALIDRQLDQPFVTAQWMTRVSATRGQRGEPVEALEWALRTEGKKPGIEPGSLLVATVHDMPLEKLAVAEAWANDHAGEAGRGGLLEAIARRRSELASRGANEE